MMNKLERALTDFDIVMRHEFEQLRKGQLELPEQYDFENFEKARLYTTKLFRLGLITEMAERIKNGRI